MAYEESARVPAKIHSLQLEGREKLSLNGVEDVSGFDESLIVLSTAQATCRAARWRCAATSGS